MESDTGPFLCVTSWNSIMSSYSSFFWGGGIVFLFGSKLWKPSLNKGVRSATGTSKRFNMMQLDAMSCQTPATGLEGAGISTQGNKFCLTARTETAGCHYLTLILLIFRIRLGTWIDLNSITCTPPQPLHKRVWVVRLTFEWAEIGVQSRDTK